jgi:hypothetical protein
VIQAFGHPSSAAIEPRSDYFASKAHYEYLARRVAAVLNGGGRFVLVTGDPPADPQVLSRALGNVLGSRYAVIDIPCGPELRGEDLERGVPVSASPLFVFDDFDQLSDQQIKEVCEGRLHADQIRAAGVLLAPLDFLARLERPALRFLKERLAAHLCVQEVGDDETVTFLHNQLLVQQDRRAEARGFRRGILLGLAGCGVVLTASIGAFVIWHSTAEQVCPVPASAGDSSLVSDKVSTLRPAHEAAPSAVPARPPPQTETTSALTTAPPPLSASPLAPTEAESSPPIAPPAREQPPAGPLLSAADIVALLGRGDEFLRAGDITSARLFYERAADAGDGLAALQLGATFDPMISSGAGLRSVTADAAQALSWYRRARALGMAEADRRIKSLETRPLGEVDTRSR